MKNLFVFFAFTLFVCFAPENLPAQKKTPTPAPKKTVVQKYAPPVFENSAELQSLVNQAAVETINKFSAKGFKSDNLAVTLIDMRDANKMKMAQFNGEVKIYPASVVKLFYLVALHQWFENGKLKTSPALERVMRDMIFISSNEATQYAVDALSDTHNGEELSPKELEKYGERRNAVNRYFAALGYQNINVNQKTYGEDLYGRERQWWNEGKNRNMLTTNATARLLAEIVLGKAVNKTRSDQMMTLLKRDWETPAKTEDADDQAHGFTAIALQGINGAKLWSKAGWTSTARHDAAYIETPDGLKFVLVVFTSNFAGERDIIPNIAHIVLKNLGEIK